MSDYAESSAIRTEVVVLGKTLACLVCGGGSFTRREIKLNTTGMSFMNLDWANKSADGAVCNACGFVHSFLGPLEWRTPAAE